MLRRIAIEELLDLLAPQLKQSPNDEDCYYSLLPLVFQEVGRISPHLGSAKRFESYYSYSPPLLFRLNFWSFSSSFFILEREKIHKHQREYYGFI